MYRMCDIKALLIYICDTSLLIGTITTVAAPAKDSHWILWILILFLVVLIPAIALITIALTKQMKKSRNTVAHDSITEENGNNNNEVEYRIKEAIQEAKSNNELSLHKWYSEEVEDHVCDICDRALSDYVFPLPAIEEGAAILVTTKTSACFATEAGVKGDTFVEMEQTHFPILDGENSHVKKI
ncbi:tumor necrosis factor receptor superfamily member 17 [Xenopus tropicalis]|uniref:Tumor necrosis factor receptor superfamily member 17 n=1 Tax=Xenopus tropicalis TaxID=8364 RepID=A0A8J0T3T8_XENTR|nr:tumor necrosis factor receptor superfamily member 17 [Xenopus tropicalis]